MCPVLSHGSTPIGLSFVHDSLDKAHQRGNLFQLRIRQTPTTPEGSERLHDVGPPIGRHESWQQNGLRAQTAAFALSINKPFQRSVDRMFVLIAMTQVWCLDTP